MDTAKPFTISKQNVWEAYKRVKSNKGAAGIDDQTIAEFEVDLKDNLYKLWNRMSSGSYFPPAVKAVPIPKKSGGERILGVPTVSDRIAQMVVKMVFEPCVEPYFLPDSYGYRPNKSALEAVGVTRQRCWQYDWLLEYDIKGLFDNLDHQLLMKAVKKHTDNKWVVLYIERWLNTPMQLPDGSLQEKTRGVMQGGVISPILSNLFLHYMFDLWMKRNYSNTPWCRYADDGLLHCRTEEEAKQLLAELTIRFKECGLELHPGKTKIVYCKDDDRTGRYENESFDFLGYTFRARKVKVRGGNYFTGFNPAISNTSAKAIRQRMRGWKLHLWSDKTIHELASMCKLVLRGWINYYGKFYKSKLYSVLCYLNNALKRWAMRKYKRLKGSIIKASEWLGRVVKSNPKLFPHWSAVENG
jgi:RNA-directed DNA polymerase